MEMKEVWKPVPGYEGLYEVSNYGRVKSLCAGRWRKEMIRRLVADKDGYMTVCLKKDGTVKNLKVHRMVAFAFIPNPQQFPEINHRNELRYDNRVENLEWCSSQYNQTYKGKHLRCCKPVYQMDMDGNIIKTYKSINDAAAAVNVTPSHLSTVLSKRRKRNVTAGGFRWSYVEGR